MKLKQVLIIIFTLVIVFYIGYNFRPAQIGSFKNIIEPSQEHHSPPSVIIEAGSAVEEASYIIFHDDETPKNYYAKNGDTGEIEFSGTDASQVIQTAIDALTNGGKIFIKAGTYLLSTRIIPKDYIWLCGEGKGVGWSEKATTLKLDDGINNDMDVIGNPADITRLYNVKITDMTIDGNKADNPSGGYGINLFSSYAVIEDVIVANCKKSGIRLWGYSGEKALENWVFRTRVVASDEDGFLIDNNCHDGYMSQSPTYNNKGAAVRLRSNAWVICNSQHSVSSAGNGIVVEGPAVYWTIHDNIINKVKDAPGYAGIVLNVTDAWIETGGKIYDNEIHSIGETPINAVGILVQSSGNPARMIDVRGNTIKDYNYAINTSTYDRYWTIKNNRFYDIQSSPAIVNLSSSNPATIKDNIGYVTENSGTAASIADGYWQPHGLASTPTIVTLTPQSNVTVWINDRNETHFQIGVSSGTVTVDWYAEV